ncbi:FeoC-like transcriptional regulator [Vibrio profundum]|uniref:FeoC-like transcriptional regulator n=1 Tax=Vibrio profundum TaxID=2910247 RepID=UPI003D10FDC5
MILAQLQSYIKKHGTASRSELAKQFALSEDGVEAMMHIWVKRGQVTRLVDTSKSERVIGVRYCTGNASSIPLTVML